MSVCFYYCRTYYKAMRRRAEACATLHSTVVSKNATVCVFITARPDGEKERVERVLERKSSTGTHLVVK